MWQNTYSCCSIPSCTVFGPVRSLHKILQSALERLFRLQYQLLKVSTQKMNCSHQFKSALQPVSQGLLPRRFKAVVLTDNMQQRFNASCFKEITAIIKAHILTKLEALYESKLELIIPLKCQFPNSLTCTVLCS